MKKMLLITLFYSAISYAQDIPILKAKSTTLSIKEGEYIFENTWGASADIKLDTYITNKFEGEIDVTFTSDIDSLTLRVDPNNEYNFKVQLENNQFAHTQIRTFHNEEASNPILKFHHKDKNLYTGVDIIDFKLSKKNRIHILGSINDSGPIDFMFDTGASVNVVTKKTDEKKVNLIINGTVKNTGADGISQKAFSTKNTIEIGNLLWDDVDFQIIDYKKNSFEAILGWVSFEYKVVEIKYDDNKIIIHNQPIDYTDYTKLKIRKFGSTPYIKASLFKNGKESKGWFGFDTGFNRSVLVSNKFSVKHKILENNKIIEKRDYTGSAGIPKSTSKIMIDKIKIGDYEIYHFPIMVNSQEMKGMENGNFLGNELLKRFNVILDFKNNYIYLKPNKLIHLPFE